MALLNVTYTPPSPDSFDLDKTCEITAQIFGYPLLSYWYFFTDPSAPELLKSKVERLYAALHAEGSGSMKDFFTNKNAFPEFLKADSELPAVRTYAQDPAFKKYWIDRLGGDGFVGAQQYYVASRYNHQSASDKAVPKENYTVNVPFLYIGTDQDAVCRPEMLQAVKGYLPDCTEVPLVHAAHWSPYEAPEEMATPIKDWLQKKFLKQ
jgi:pimeloyl-ACP methyl ester carboxylesterase